MNRGESSLLSGTAAERLQRPVAGEPHSWRDQRVRCEINVLAFFFGGGSTTFSAGGSTTYSGGTPIVLMNRFGRLWKEGLLSGCDADACGAAQTPPHAVEGVGFARESQRDPRGESNDSTEK